MSTIDQAIQDAAQKIINLRPDPAPYFRLLRDVLRVPSSDPEYQAARDRLLAHPHACELADTQEPDGTWGRFHSQDSSLKRRFVTSEAAIERALALGLDQDSPVLQRAVGFIVNHLTSRAEWSDHSEKHDSPLLWPYYTRLISAANLALIDPRHPLLAETSRQVADMAAIAFRSGAYRQEDEIAARLAVTGIESKTHGFLVSKYGLILLAVADLPPALEDCVLEYILRKPDGIYYVYGRCALDCPPVDSKLFPGWLGAQEALARFGGWQQRAVARRAEAAMVWILGQQNADGLWDFSRQAGQGRYFPLSTNWRRPENRVIDCSVRVLALLKRFTG